MLLTDRFVYVHLPKTGGTFVERNLKRLLGPPRKPGLLPRLLRGRRRTVRLAKHAPCARIPRSHARLPVLSNVRNPFSHLVSMYHFAWWRETPPRSLDMDAIVRRFPRFPDLTFPEYVEMLYDHSRPPETDRVPLGGRLGYLSRRLVRFYARDPRAAFRRIDERWIEDRRFREEFHRVRFLRMARLNDELADALVEFGHDPDDVAFIRTAPRVVPAGPDAARRPSRPWEEFWTPRLVRQVREREVLFRAMFPWSDGLEVATAAPRRAARP